MKLLLDKKKEKKKERKHTLLTPKNLSIVRIKKKGSRLSITPDHFALNSLSKKNVIDEAYT